jgi:hypothetical protein
VRAGREWQTEVILSCYSERGLASSTAILSKSGKKLKSIIISKNTFSLENERDGVSRSVARNSEMKKTEVHSSKGSYFKSYLKEMVS